MINKIIDDVQINLERLKQKYIWLIFLLFYITIVGFIGQIINNCFPIFNNTLLNNTFQMAINMLIFTVLITGEILIIKNANYSVEIKLKEEALKAVDFTNAYGNPPSLLAIEKKGYGVIYHMYSVLLPLVEYEKNKDKIQNAWNIEIRTIDYERDHRHIAIKAVDSQNAYPEIIPWKDEYMSDKDFVIKLGQGDFEEVSINLTHYPHVLLASGSGGGKTCLLNLILVQSYKKGAQIGIIDFKGGLDYMMWTEKCSVITTAEECLAYLNDLIHIFNERINLLVKAKVTNIECYNSKETLHLPRIIVVCDEMADVLGVKPKNKNTKEIYDAIENCINFLTRKARAVGIHVFLCFQRPSSTILSGDIKINLGYKICGRADEIMSDMVLENHDAAEMIPQNSKGFFVSNMGGLFKAYYYDITSVDTSIEKV